MILMTGWRFGALVAGLVTTIAVAFYPIGISPMLFPEKYKQMQKETRAGVNKDDIQPGNMKVWTDPFGRKKPSPVSSES